MQSRPDFVSSAECHHKITRDDCVDSLKRPVKWVKKVLADCRDKKIYAKLSESPNFRLSKSIDISRERAH